MLLTQYVLLMQGVKKTKKRQLRVQVSEIQNDLSTIKCCKKRCLNYVPLETAVSERKCFWTKKTQADQRNFIISTIRNALITDDVRRMFRIANCTQMLCRKAWCTIYGIKDTR